MALMDSMLSEEQQQPETSSRFHQKKGAWFDWLADEREAEDNGWDFSEWQTKKGKTDDTVNWADPAAWQKPKPTVSKTQQSGASPLLQNSLATAVNDATAVEKF